MKTASCTEPSPVAEGHTPNLGLLIVLKDGRRHHDLV